MTDAPVTVKATELRQWLHVLAQEEGVQRPDLCKLLMAELSGLRDFLDIDLSKGPIATLKTIAGILHAHIYQLTPDPPGRKN